jgi:hypothetical protein
MALGTITKPANIGASASDYNDANKRVRVRVVQLSSGANYTTGGETITPAAVGLNVIMEAIPMGLALTTSGTTSRAVAYLFQANGSVKQLVHTTASAEAASNSDQSTFSVLVKFVGR